MSIIASKIKAENAAMIGSLSENAGTGGQIFVAGDNTCGLIRVITGTGCTGQQVAIVSFQTPVPFDTDNVCVVLNPASRNAIPLNIIAEGTDAEGFELNCQSVLADSTEYDFYYQVFELNI